MYNQNMTLRAFGAAAIALIFATAALAQQPGRIRGQIEKADGPMLSLKTRDGAMLNVKLADDVRVSALEKASLSDIKNDSFIGIAGIPQPDGSIEAFSIFIFSFLRSAALCPTGTARGMRAPTERLDRGVVVFSEPASSSPAW